MYASWDEENHERSFTPEFAVELLAKSLILKLNYKQISPLDMLLCQKVVETPHLPI